MSDNFKIAFEVSNKRLGGRIYVLESVVEKYLTEAKEVIQQAQPDVGKKRHRSVFRKRSYHCKL